MKKPDRNIDDTIESLQQEIGYRFNEPALLHEALTHKSFSNENPEEPAACNERLEFLGDAVLDLVISQRCFLDYPDLPEGELTRVRAELVREKSLADAARKLDLGSCLRMGRGERRSGGENKDSLLANAIEALIGAVFLDAGYRASQDLVDRFFHEGIRQAVNNEFSVDHKTTLQEFCQRIYHEPPVYQMVAVTGPDHQRHYTVAVLLKGKRIATGAGRSKKLAEQDAARGALEVLKA